MTAALPGAQEEKRIAIYSIIANYSLPVYEQAGQDYVGMLEILEPLGTVASQTNGTQWKLRYNDVESQFTANTPRVRIQNRDFNMPANFVLANGRGLVPLSSLGTLLPQILGGPVTFHESSRRLYIGSVGVHFTAQIGNSNPPALVMNFTSPVNPRIATEPGKVQMLFTHDPLVAPSSTNLTFDSRSIPSAIYQESNGAAEIIVNTRVPLFASFSDNGRTITLSPVAQVKTAESSPSTAAPPAAESATPSVIAPSDQVPPMASTTAVFVVVDASHGGEERGATLSDQITEKDVTLAFAQRLRQALEAKGFATLMVRDGDTAMSLDQRADVVNQAHAKVYICIHATSLGKGVRIYSGWMPSAGENNGPFLNWNSAQAGFLQLSQSVASGLTEELRNENITARFLAAPIRPLNNVATAALAIEIAPKDDISSVQSPEYQTAVANGIVTSIANMRTRLESGQ